MTTLRTCGHRALVTGCNTCAADRATDQATYLAVMIAQERAEAAAAALADAAAKVRALLDAGDALNLAGGSRNAGGAGPERDRRNRGAWYEASVRWTKARAAMEPPK